MAVEEKKFLGSAGVEKLITNIRGEISAGDKDTLAAANEYANSLADNYDPAGTAATKVSDHNTDTVAHSDIRNDIAEVVANVDNLNKEKITFEIVEDLPETGILANRIYYLYDGAKYFTYVFEVDTGAPAESNGSYSAEFGTWKRLTNEEQVLSVNGKTGTVTLDASDVGADPEGTAAAKVQELANGQVKTNTEHIGTMDNLETTAKSDLVNAINEVRNAVSAGGTAAAITMTENTTGLGEGVLKSYTIKQGDNTVGTINIPKDMVVQSGEVVVDPEGQPAGTYIKLVLANATNDEIFVNVGNLVDIYKAKASAAQVQLAIDSTTREISASIVAGSITATELATDAVTTVKIADGNVTKAKLSTDVQTALDKAHEHSNKEELDKIVSGDVAKWNAAQANAEATAAADATSKANKALEDAKSYADSKVAGVDLSGIATNAADIDKLEASLASGGATANDIADAKKAGTDAQAAIEALEDGEVASLRTDVDALKSVNYVEITPSEIDNMFAAE